MPFTAVLCCLEKYVSRSSSAQTPSPPQKHYTLPLPTLITNPSSPISKTNAGQLRCTTSGAAKEFWNKKVQDEMYTVKMDIGTELNPEQVEVTVLSLEEDPTSIPGSVDFFYPKHRS